MIQTLTSQVLYLLTKYNGILYESEGNVKNKNKLVLVAKPC